MKTFYIILLCVISVGAQELVQRRQPLVPSSTASPTYVISEDFETPSTGYEEAWSEVGGGSYFPTDNHFPVGGSGQNLQIVGGGAAVQRSFTAMSSNYWFTAFATSRTNVQHQIMLTFSNGVERAALFVRNTGLIASYDQSMGFGASPTEPIPANTLIFIWWKTDHGAGTTEVAWSTDQTAKPSSGSRWATNSCSTGITIDRIWLQMEQTGTNSFDKIRLDDVAIGSSPQ